jgi:hypothetical protein
MHNIGKEKNTNEIELEGTENNVYLHRHLIPNKGAKYLHWIKASLPNGAGGTGY